jgi:hypothetical protein
MTWSRITNLRNRSLYVAAKARKIHLNWSVTGENPVRSDDWPALTEILQKREVLLGLKEAINQSLVYSSEKEQLKVDVLSHRALHPQCSFDRKHRLMIFALALAPDQVSWIFKLRERIHHFHCHH